MEMHEIVFKKLKKVSANVDSRGLLSDKCCTDIVNECPPLYLKK